MTDRGTDAASRNEGILCAGSLLEIIRERTEQTEYLGQIV